MAIKASSSSHFRVSILQLMLLTMASYLFCHQALAADLGRLFTSPAERHALDKLRRENKPQNDMIDQNSTGKKTKIMVYNGIVRRSNGDKQIWINGKPVTGRKGVDGIRISKGPDHNHQVMVAVPEKNKVVRIKPGQQWDLESGQVADAYSTSSKKSVNKIKP